MSEDAPAPFTSEDHRIGRVEKGPGALSVVRPPSQSCGGSRQPSRGHIPSSVTPWGTPPPSRQLTRTPSQGNLLTKLRYKEVLDWIGTLPLPHIKTKKGPIQPETLQDGNLLWDIALHVLRPDLPNNRDEIEQFEGMLEDQDGATNSEQKCKTLRELGHSYHRMGMYGSAIEMHSTQLHFASTLVTSGGNMDFMQQAIGDLGDVFRTLGEKEIAHNMYKTSLGIPTKKNKSTLRSRGTTPGDLQPWPSTPDHNDILEPRKERTKIRRKKTAIDTKTGKGNDGTGRRSQTQQVHYTPDVDSSFEGSELGSIPTLNRRYEFNNTLDGKYESHLVLILIFAPCFSHPSICKREIRCT